MTAPLLTVNPDKLSDLHTGLVADLEARTLVVDKSRVLKARG